MRVVVLTTHTNNTPAFYEPLRGLGHEVHVVVYDLLAPDAFGHLPRWVAAARPDLVVLVGAHPDFHPRPVVHVDVLALIGRAHRLVHLCCDAAEPVWWPVLDEYQRRGNFALQVAIDGVRTGPIGDHGLTLLSPFDPGLYPSPLPPWASRPVELGFPGSPGGGDRSGSISTLQVRGVLTVRLRTDGDPAAYREFLTRCRCVLNHAATGSLQRLHVKGRPVEAAHAGAVLLEQAGSPLADWFTPGADYLTWGSVDEVADKLAWVRASPHLAAAMAARLRARVLDEHSPAAFWGHVFARVGLGREVRPPRELPRVPWSLAPIAEPTPYQEPPPPPLPAGVMDPPLLLATRNRCNLVRYNQEFYVVPQRLGRVHLANHADRARPGIQRFPSEVEALRAMG